VHLDELDVAVLFALLEDARASNREVARRVGSSPTTVGERLRRLEAAGLVVGATLRLAPEALPGHNRFLQGSVGPDDAEAVLEAARGTPGVVEAVVSSDGRLFVVLVVRDLGEEERLIEALQRAGASGLGVVGVRRVSGPPPVHLFQRPGGSLEPCAQCGKEVEEPIVQSVEGRRVAFCCPSCERLYLQRYEELSRKAKE
jgi:Lrp/AsnC family transcriptional regulator, leucine-responsive regulatory protein